ncbi:TPA: hypothetical protein DF272_01440 [Candidatus Falkowbacteria bacterium]|nr:hypothetical protein [Candidatus Falkowbacteria bacterium]
MMKNLLLVIIIVLLAALLGLAAFFYFGERAAEPTDNTNSTTDITDVANGANGSRSDDSNTNSDPRTNQPSNTRPVDELIRVVSPKVGDTVSNPIQYSGEARGQFYFEGSFPVRLETPSGKIIAQSFATAQGEWMTENFVPFTGQLTFNYADIEDGRLNLVFEKDNAGDLPLTANDRKVIAIYIQDAPDRVSFNVYFLNDDLDNNPNSCAEVFPIVRSVPFTQAVARAALETLIEGPDGLESESGYTSVVPTATINSLAINNGTLTVDFRGNSNDWSGGSCRVTAMRQQILRTASQFPTVNNVVISVNGEVDTIFQP